jgi:hypothetical protein
MICKQGIPNETLRLQVGKRGFSHLLCLRETQWLPISLLSSSVRSRCIEEEEALEALKGKVEAWNQQLGATETTIQPIYRSKAVFTAAPADRRLLLEAFKYLKPQEVERTAAIVCKGWYHISREEELWAAIYGAVISGLACLWSERERVLESSEG